MERWIKTGTLKRKSNEIQEESSAVNTNRDSQVEDGRNVDTTKKATISTDKIDETKKESMKTDSTKKRKYDSEYLKYGFTYVGGDDCPLPQCLICTEVLSNSSMAPSKLSRHLQTKHAEFKNKPYDFFKRKLEEVEKERHKMTATFKSEPSQCLEASYKISYRIACAGEAHVIGENLIKPCILDATETLLDEKNASKMINIPLSNDSVKRRIVHMSEHIKSELLARLRNCGFFVIQLDESCDVANEAILLVFVRYLHAGEIHEDLLMCKSLERRTTGEDIFNVLNEFFIENNLDWEKCIDVCTDGAPAMVGKLSGAVARIKRIAPNCKSSHCMLHREALAAKSMPSNLKDVLDTCVKIVNAVKARPLASRLFSILCNEMGSQFLGLLYHTEIRWLSRGNVLLRVFEMRHEINIFYASETTAGLNKKLHDPNFLLRLAYLADIFGKLNHLNLCLQGRSVNILTASDKINGMKSKLRLWIRRVTENDFTCFENLSTFSQENEIEISDEIRNDIQYHLEQLKNSLNEYFPPDSENYDWLRNPFLCNQASVKLPAKDCEQIADLSSDSNLKQQFSSVLLPTFWASISGEYPDIAQRAIKILLPFPTTYLCESAFSLYASTKSKSRNRLNAEPDMRLQLSSIKPDFRQLISEKQLQKH